MISLEYKVIKNGKTVRKITTLCADDICASRHLKAIQKFHIDKGYEISEVKRYEYKENIIEINKDIKSIIIEENIND